MVTEVPTVMKKEQNEEKWREREEEKKGCEKVIVADRDLCKC